MTDIPVNSPQAANGTSDSVRFGDTLVTAFSDGYFDIAEPLLIGPSGEPFDGTPNPLHIQVNTFLVQTPDRTILIDTGCGHELGPTVNKLLPNLAAAGVHPEAIDTVLCTHIHPDHTNGLIDASGAARFPNAEIYVHQRELDFWLSDEEKSRAPEAQQIYFTWAKKSFDAYAGRVETFDRGYLFNRIGIVPLFGHTPGHCGFQIDGGGDHLVIWGDCVHAIEVQSRNPDIGFAADIDRDAARHTRWHICDMAATDGCMVSGMHLPFPGFGRLVRDGKVFSYIPH